MYDPKRVLILLDPEAFPNAGKPPTFALSPKTNAVAFERAPVAAVFAIKDRDSSRPCTCFGAGGSVQCALEG